MNRSLQVAVIIALVSAAPAGAVVAAQAPEPVPQGVGGDAPQAAPVPWPIRLGMRVATLQQRIPTQDRVVLVPDEATFLDELAKWSPSARWPVLIEDPVLSPMFIRAFAPKQVVRRTDRAAPASDAAALSRAIDAAVTRSFGGDPAAAGPAQAMQATGFMPTGLAVYSAKDPALVAAAALAAGRGMIPVAVEGDFGAPGDTLDPSRFASLDAALLASCTATQLPFGAMGDALDAIVLCRSVAHAVALDPAVTRVPSAQGLPPIKAGEPFALTDALGRTPTGGRYAVCGNIFGNAARASFMAMSSLFLPRSTIWAIDTYGPAAEMFRPFGVDALGAGLTDAGFAAMTLSGEGARRTAWRDLLAKGFTCDVLFLNSSGNADFFDLGTPGKTPASDCAAPGDVPVLARPLALSMVHSFSLQQPNARETVGGRWLDHGVYAYAGSVHEPYLLAFVPPAQVLEQMVNGVPFGVAARIWEGPFALPWRIAIFGDPLMLCIAPKGMPPPARVAPTPMVPGQVDVVLQCRASLAKCKGDTKGDATIAAMRELSAAAQDRLVVELWRLVSNQPWAARIAPEALESLWVTRDAAGFLKAYALTAAPTSRQRDMLWQLCAPMLPTLKDRDMLLVFERAIRPTWPSKDLERLVPAMVGGLGVDHARRAVLRVQAATKNPQQQAAVTALLAGL
jgi:hypothetical protein